MQYEEITLEHYLCECIHKKFDFCLSFKEIPFGKELERRLRMQFSDYFQKLETQHEEDSYEKPYEAVVH